MLKEKSASMAMSVITDVPEMLKKFDPWHIFFDGNEYIVEDSFTEYVLKCTHLPSYMPALSLLNQPLAGFESDQDILKSFPEGKTISSPMEICQAAAYLTHSDWENLRPAGIIDMSGKKTIIGYLNGEISVTASYDAHRRKWRLASQELATWEEPVDLLVFKISRGKVADLGIRKN